MATPAWQGGRGPAGEARGEGVADDRQPHAREAEGRGAQAEEQAYGAPAAALGCGESPEAGETGISKGEKATPTQQFFHVVKFVLTLQVHIAATASCNKQFARFISTVVQVASYN